jgi:hypothetical protein
VAFGLFAISQVIAVFAEVVGHEGKHEWRIVLGEIAMLGGAMFVLGGLILLSMIPLMIDQNAVGGVAIGLLVLSGAVTGGWWLFDIVLQFSSREGG